MGDWNEPLGKDRQKWDHHEKVEGAQIGRLPPALGINRRWREGHGGGY